MGFRTKGATGFLDDLAADPYFTNGYRAVLVFDRKPRSFIEIENFDWEQPVSYQLKRLTVDQTWDLEEEWRYLRA
jgi:hypothetical protein